MCLHFLIDPSTVSLNIYLGITTDTGYVIKSHMGKKDIGIAGHSAIKNEIEKKWGGRLTGETKGEHTYTYIYIYMIYFHVILLSPQFIHTHTHMCVCMCVRATERERESCLLNTSDAADE